MGDLTDCYPLVRAASLGKLRLVRLLVEGGADVNGSNLRGDTALVAACKSLRCGEDVDDTVNGVLKVINYLLQNKAEPNAQDQCGRTALMFACEQKATAVVSSLLRAGADPTTQDQCGASALVYALRAQHPPTLKVILEACRAMGRDIIIVTTDTATSGTNPSEEATKDFLNIPLSPDSTLLCMSPSDIVLKTSASNSPEAGNVFNFRGEVGIRDARSYSVPKQRGLSEPWLSIPDLTHLCHTYERAITQRGDHPNMEEHNPGSSQSLFTLPHASSNPPDHSNMDQFPPCPVPQSLGRRYTLPTMTLAPPVLHFPPLNHKSDIRGKDCSQTLASKVSMVFVPRPPSSAPPPSSKGSVRAALLKPRVMGSSGSAHILMKHVRREKR